MGNNSRATVCGLSIVAMSVPMPLSMLDRRPQIQLMPTSARHDDLESTPSERLSSDERLPMRKWRWSRRARTTSRDVSTISSCTAANVLNALDQGTETHALLKTAYARSADDLFEVEIPGSGYGVKRAVAGALQHVQLAARSEDAFDNVKAHAAHVTASLENVQVDRRCDSNRRAGSWSRRRRRRSADRRRAFELMVTSSAVLMRTTMGRSGGKQTKAAPAGKHAHAADDEG